MITIGEQVKILVMPYKGQTGTVISYDDADEAILGVLYLVELSNILDSAGNPMRVYYLRSELELA